MRHRSRWQVHRTCNKRIAYRNGLTCGWFGQQTHSEISSVTQIVSVVPEWPSQSQFRFLFLKPTEHTDRDYRLGRQTFGLLCLYRLSQLLPAGRNAFCRHSWRSNPIQSDCLRTRRSRFEVWSSNLNPQIEMPVTRFFWRELNYSYICVN